MLTESHEFTSRRPAARKAFDEGRKVKIRWEDKIYIVSKENTVFRDIRLLNCHPLDLEITRFQSQHGLSYTREFPKLFITINLD